MSGERRRCIEVILSRTKFVLVAVVALAVSLPCAPPAWGQGNSGNNPGSGGGNAPGAGQGGNGPGVGQGPGQGQGQGQGRGHGRAHGRRRGATPKVEGPYEIQIAGYYTGGGTAEANAAVSIRAKVTDPNGTTSILQASGLEVINNRFRGNGSLGGRDVLIIGRVDERDEVTDEKKVLKKSRILFTFRDGTRYGRGAGERIAEPQPAN